MVGTAEPVATGREALLPRHRVVLLGASNLTRGLPSVLAASFRFWGRPLDVLVAHGNGRSYGATSCVLGRSLPGILQSGLWDDLASRPPLPTAALITDVGNDLLYGYPIERIIGWIERCLDRLEQHGARVVLTALPEKHLSTLSLARFYFFRTLFVPSNRMRRERVVELVYELNGRLAALAKDRNLPLVSQQREWYGVDPMHLRLKHWSQAWGDILGRWGECVQSDCEQRYSFGHWLRLQSLPPQQRRIFGIAQRAAQPCARLDDGTVLSIY